MIAVNKILLTDIYVNPLPDQYNTNLKMTTSLSKQLNTRDIPGSGTTDIEGLFNLIGQNIKAMVTLRKCVLHAGSESNAITARDGSSMFLVSACQDQEPPCPVEETFLIAQKEDAGCTLTESDSRIVDGAFFQDDVHNIMHTLDPFHSDVSGELPRYSCRKGRAGHHIRKTSLSLNEKKDAGLENYLEEHVDKSRYGFVSMDISNFR